jgi:hypothetical protein
MGVPYDNTEFAEWQWKYFLRHLKPNYPAEPGENATLGERARWSNEAKAQMKLVVWDDVEPTAFRAGWVAAHAVIGGDIEKLVGEIREELK